MKSEVAHETEIHRQHVRLKVPIRIEIDGARYGVEDWSVGGFGVENVLTSRAPGERCRVRVVFPFAGFELSLRVDAQMVYVDRDHQRFGCRFLALTAEQRDVFHYVADACLSGEIVTARDLLQAHVQGGVAAPRDEPAPGMAGSEAGAAPGRRGWRYARPAALGFGAALLLGFGAVGVNDRYLTVTATSAVVDAPLHRLRAPIAGRFAAATEPGQLVEPGEALAMVRGVDGTVAPLRSPCACVVLDQPGASDRFYQPGAALMTLVEPGQAPRVRAEVTPGDAGRLKVGDRAAIRLPGQGEVLRGEIERIDLRPALAGSGSDAVPLPVDRRLAQVLIRPERPLALDDIGTLVAVRFGPLVSVGLR